MSLCDRCYAPGQCCKSLAVSGGGWAQQTRATYLDALAFVRRHDLPFNPTVPEATEPGHWFWRFSCPKLGDDGRCTIYDTRPQICRSFQPQSDELCVHFRGSTMDGVESGPEVIDNEAPWPKAEPESLEKEIAA